MAALVTSPLLLPEAQAFYAQHLTSSCSEMSLEEMRCIPELAYGSVPAGDSLKVGYHACQAFQDAYIT